MKRLDGRHLRQRVFLARSRGKASLLRSAGSQIGRCYPRHRGREFLSFLREIERNVAANLDVHLIMDNYATHKTEPIRKWLGARPRWHVHFTPTAGSWVNQVERFFADVTEKQIRRGVHRSTVELETAIRGLCHSDDTRSTSGMACREPVSC
jgi:transposase